MTWIVVVLMIGAIIVLLRRRGEATSSTQSQQSPSSARPVSAREQHPRTPARDDDEIDRTALEAAEREVKDLETDVKGRPLEDAIGDDWGPGTPKPPYI